MSAQNMFNIDKLIETNYDTWSLQIKAILVHQDLWDVVSSNEIKDDAVWKRSDEKALSTIILTVTPMQLSYIKNSKTANNAWNALKDIHRPKGPVRKVTLFKKLLCMRMSENDCIQEYLCKFACVVEKLAEIEITLQEDLLVIMVMASLPKSFENFVVALETRDQLPTLSVLKVKLIEEGQRRKAVEDSNNNDDAVQVFMAQAKKNQNQQAQKNIVYNNKNVKCYNCHQRRL